MQATQQRSGAYREALTDPIAVLRVLAAGNLVRVRRALVAA
jgi:hypothetical protein